MKFIIFTLASCLVLTMCYAHIGGGASLQNISPQVYCGRSLARAMAFLCFEEDGFEKRSDVGTMYGQVLPPYYKDQEVQMNLPWAGRARSLSLAARGKRTSGIVTECCDKPCSINELLSYC
ncbi:PREDICTED: bombyxin A-2-like [Papilio xuthus]|uniref:Bombyxin A-2-like n=1 Tax=Papilio xuthus TaxID=66420 RepID=A0AAJ6YYM3_PAPXU|nr:PREDICTED: bombyxin A-2-like [Papilio xuthus]